MTFPWGYDVKVRARAFESESGIRHDSGETLGGKMVDEANGKFKIAPVFVPSNLGGDYWVVDYSEREGYALISGGEPTIATPDGRQCGAGVNNAGLFIYTRQQRRN